MKQLHLFDLMRAWAAATGLVIAVLYFGALALDITPSPILPLLLAAIGGFELFLFVQDVVLKRDDRAPS